MQILVALFIVGLACLASAEEHNWHGCEALERLKVLQQWHAILGEKNHRTDFGIAIYRAYFDEDPSLQKYYLDRDVEDDHDPRFRAAVAGSLVRLNTLMTLLSDEDAFQAQCKYIHKLHEKVHLPHDAMNTFGAALEKVIPARLGRCFDFSAWSKCWTHIVKSIRSYDAVPEPY